MNARQDTPAQILSEQIVERVMSLQRMGIVQIEGATQTIREAASCLETEGRDEARRLIVEAANSLRATRLLVEKIDEWTFGNHEGFVAEQGRSVIAALAAVNAEFQRAASAFAASTGQ